MSISSLSSTHLFTAASAVAKSTSNTTTSAHNSIGRRAVASAVPSDTSTKKAAVATTGAHNNAMRVLPTMASTVNLSSTTKAAITASVATASDAKAATAPTGIGSNTRIIPTDTPTSDTAAADLSSTTTPFVTTVASGTDTGVMHGGPVKAIDDTSSDNTRPPQQGGPVKSIGDLAGTSRPPMHGGPVRAIGLAETSIDPITLPPVDGHAGPLITAIDQDV